MGNAGHAREEKSPSARRIIFGEGELEAVVESRGEYGLRVLRFTSKTGFHEALERLGHIPLAALHQARGRARSTASVIRPSMRGREAPWPRLPRVCTSLPKFCSTSARANIEIAEITLDVGLGTFEPVRTERLEDHKIHLESYEISEATAEAIERAQREHAPVLAIGTTVVRALEDAAEKAAARRRHAEPGRAEAAIFLYPGKPLRIVNQLLTNFHLPQSSLLALVATFAGRENILRAYRHAVAAGYRFYSYGDCMLIR